MKRISLILGLCVLQFIFASSVVAQSYENESNAFESGNVLDQSESSMESYDSTKIKLNNAPVVELSPEEAAAEKAAKDEYRRSNKIMIFTAVGVGIAIGLFCMQFLMAGGK